jgi:type II secretory pathway pseudopilin PulG
MNCASTGSLETSLPIVAERPSQTEGFSLVEVISALVIASLALVVLLRGLGGSQLAAVYLDAHLGARVIAQSILEDERQAGETVAGTRNGDSGMYQWRLTVAPAVIDGTGRLPAGYQLYRLAVEVTWQPRGRLALDTLKLGR